MNKEQSKSGINEREPESQFVTLSKEEYVRLKDGYEMYEIAVKYNGEWRKKYGQLEKAYEALNKTCESAMKEMRATNKTIVQMAERVCQYNRCPYDCKPKNCKPYTGPKVVQMFPKSK